jgi:hypothetical protein
MADMGNTVGGFLSGFNNTYFTGVRANEAEKLRQDELALRKAQDDRANALQQFQMQKYAEAEAKDRQAAGLYAGMLGIKPTTFKSLDGADAEAAGDFMPEVANPQYEQFLAGGAKAGADMVKQTREQQTAELKARTDAWKEAQAQRMADLKDKQIMAMIARGNGGGGKQQLFSMSDGSKIWIRPGDTVPDGATPWSASMANAEKKSAEKDAKAQEAKLAALETAKVVADDIGRVKSLVDKPGAVDKRGKREGSSGWCAGEHRL